MPIEKPQVNPEFKEYTQKKWLKLILIMGIAFTGIKGVEGIIKNQVDKDEFSVASAQTNDENIYQSPPNSDSEFIVESAVNKKVLVYGTGGDGLLLRQEPGKNAEILASAWDGESFIFTGKTANQDGYLWYQLKDEISGDIYWAASDYLKY
jgi:hypothetical protein